MGEVIKFRPRGSDPEGEKKPTQETDSKSETESLPENQKSDSDPSKMKLDLKIQYFKEGSDEPITESYIQTGKDNMPEILAVFGEALGPFLELKQFLMSSRFDAIPTPTSNEDPNIVAVRSYDDEQLMSYVINWNTTKVADRKVKFYKALIFECQRRFFRDSIE